MSFRRVVIALDTASSMAAVPTALGLARKMHAEIVGLFIEDSDLIELASLPFAGEVGFASATRRPLDLEAMELTLRAHARRMRHELGERLAGESVKWSFEVVRGRTIPALATAVAGRDVVVVSVGRSAARERAKIARAFEALGAPLLIAGESPRADAIAVLAAPNTPADETAESIAALAPYYGRSALFVTASREQQHWLPWQREIAMVLAERGIASRLRAIADATRDVLERIVAEERAQLVVGLAAEPSLRDALLDALPYPLLVLPKAAAEARDGDG